MCPYLVKLHNLYFRHELEQAHHHHHHLTLQELELNLLLLCFLLPAAAVKKMAAPRRLDLTSPNRHVLH